MRGNQVLGTFHFKREHTNGDHRGSWRSNIARFQKGNKENIDSFLQVNIWRDTRKCVHISMQHRPAKFVERNARKTANYIDSHFIIPSHNVAVKFVRGHESYKNKYSPNKAAMCRVPLDSANAL